jgi:hypothetical protein
VPVAVPSTAWNVPIETGAGWLAVAGLGEGLCSIIAGLGDSTIAGLGDSTIAGLGDGVAAALLQAPAAKATAKAAAASGARRECVCQCMVAVLLSC